MKDKFKFFTDPSYEEEANSYRILCLILLLAVVLAGWGFFLNWGSIPFDFHDWAEVNAPRLAFLKDAVTKGELPLHMPDSSALRGERERRRRMERRRGRLQGERSRSCRRRRAVA